MRVLQIFFGVNSALIITILINCSIFDLDAYMKFRRTYKSRKKEIIKNNKNLLKIMACFTFTTFLKSTTIQLDTIIKPETSMAFYCLNKWPQSKKKRNNNKMSQIFHLVRIIIQNYNWVTRIFAHTLRWNLKFSYEVTAYFVVFSLCTKRKSKRRGNQVWISA